MLILNRRTLPSVLLGVSLLFHGLAFSQSNWPTKPVKMIVPFAAGSFTDLAARAVSAELSQQLGQQFIVENRVGAGGTIGANVVATSAGDGYTLLLTDNSFVMAAGLYPKLPYDPLKDFTQISQIAESPSIMLARPGLAAKSVKELVALARSKPKQLNFGSGGMGSSAHLATELFLNVTGTEMTHIPFKGVAAAITEVMADRVDVSVASLASGAAHVKSGRLQGFGVTGSERSPVLPNVPTFVESGFGGYNMNYWWGIAAPASTPAAIITLLNKEIRKAAVKPELLNIFQAQGAKPVTTTPAEMTQIVQSDITVWKNIIKKADVHIE